MRKLIRMLPLLAVWSALSLTSSAEAKNLDEAVDEMAKQIKVYLEEKQQLQISIGNFEGPPGTSSGRKLENLLKAKLESENIEVAPFARWEVRGDFQIDTSDEFARVAIQLSLVNASGVEVSEFRKRADVAVDELEDVLAIAQPSGFDGESAVLEESAVSDAASGDSVTVTEDPASAEDSAAQPSATDTAPPTTPATDSGTPPPATEVAQSLPPATDTPPTVGTTPGTPGANVATAELPSAQAREQRLLDSIRNGGFHQVNPNTIAASSTSPYHIQMQVRRAGASIFEPIEIVKVGSGLAFCDLQEGDQYSIIVTNTAPHDVGLELQIDGINSLHFSEIPSFVETGKWMIRGTENNGGQPYSARINGWYRNPQSVYAFQISSEPDAVASTLGFPAKIGTITATFYGAWVGDDIHPLEAKLLAENFGSRGEGIGTRQGPSVESNSDVVERKFGQFPLASVSIRYVNPDPPENLPNELPVQP